MRHCAKFIVPAAAERMLADSMRLAQDGDRQAYALVLDHCRDAFVRLARERCPAGISEAEIVDRCLVTVHRARHTFDPKRSFSVWLEAVVRHHCIGAVRIGPRRAWRTRIGWRAAGLMGVTVPPDEESAN